MTVSIEEKKIYDYLILKLVSDSLKQMESQNQQPSVIASRGTWDGTAFPADVSLREIANMDVFYWNESLDEEVRKLVESCEFNFALIALSLKKVVNRDALVHYKPMLRKKLMLMSVGNVLAIPIHWVPPMIFYIESEKR